MLSILTMTGRVSSAALPLLSIALLAALHTFTREVGGWWCVREKGNVKGRNKGESGG